MTEAKQIEALLPSHEAELSLIHNEHRSYYQPIEDWITEHESLNTIEWVSAEERARAIATDSVWVLQWYPNTPVGFNVLAASDLETLLRATSRASEE